MSKPEYQPKTGQRCGCRRGEQRDNCGTCEGTGWVIDFAAIRARNGVVTPPAALTVAQIERMVRS